MVRPIVEVSFGYSLSSPTAVFTDISRQVNLVRGIEINRGAQNELQQIQAGTCTMTLDNSDGRFTPDRPSSPYYPGVKKGVLIRVLAVTMDPRSGAGPWPISQLSDDFDDDRLDPVLWVNSYGGASETGGRGRVPCNPGAFAGLQTMRNWQASNSQVTARVATLPSLNGSSSATGSFYLNSTTSGTRLGFQYNAATGNIRCVSDVAFSDGSAVSLAFSWVSTNWWRIREAAGTVYWETSGDGYTWTVRRSLATPAWLTSQLLTLSMDTSRTGGTGDVYEIDMVGATSHPRFFGFVNDWPVDWKGLMSEATITCSDLFTWASINRALQPMLVQEVLLDRPTVYYPLTEPSDSVSAGDLSGTASVASLAITQAGSGGTLEFGAGTGPNGLPCPQFTPASTSAGKYLSADLGPNFVEANVNFRVRAECWFSTSTTGRVLMGLASSDGATKMLLLLEPGTGEMSLEKKQPSTSDESYVFGTPNLANGALHHVVYSEFENLLYVDGVSYSLPANAGADLRLLTVGGFQNTRLWSGTIAHVAVYCRSVTAAELSGHYTTGTTGHAGEAADDRLNRIASYARLAVTVQGSTFDGMAPQTALGRSALEHLREIETTESGKLFSSRTGPLVFQSRDLRYNPSPALSLSYADLETDDVKYAYDDQKMVNSALVSRPGGATQRFVNAASIDWYGEKERQLDLLKDSDNAASDAGTWLISRYAEPVAEVRQVPIEAFSMPLATYRALLNVEVSTVLGLTNLPAQAPASSTALFVEGYTERIGLGQHRLDFHTSRADTDTVWVLDDPVYSVLGSTTRLAY